MKKNTKQPKSLRSLWTKTPLEYVYLVVALVLGLAYMFVLAPLSAPDEVGHYISAYQLSSKLMGETSNSPDGYVLIRPEDLYIEDSNGDYVLGIDEYGYLRVDGEQLEGHTVLGQELTRETYRNIKNFVPNESQPMGATRAISVCPPVRTTPVAYLPQAIGIAIARVLGLNSIWLLYLGRLCNLLFFVGAVFLALRRLPFGKEVMFGVALLPMTLHLSASMSYDVLIMAGLFYFTAVCLDLAYQKERVTIADVALLAVLIAVFGPCKMVYAIFLGLCLLIPVKKFGSWGRWTIAAGSVLAVLVVSLWLVNRQMITVYATTESGYSVIDWAEETGYSFSYILSHPKQTLWIFYQTILLQAEYYHLTMIGAYLGNLDQTLQVPYLLVWFFTGALAVLSLQKPGETIRITGARRIWIWVLCLACIGATMLSMLIAWTPLSSIVIGGVQGRYFLPFLPILFMSLKNRTVVLTKNVDRSILYLMCLANVYILVHIFRIVCTR